VPSPARARAAAEAGVHAGAAAGARLELRLPRRLAPRRCGHSAAAGQGRGRPEAAAADQHRARRRPPLRRRMMRRRQGIAAGGFRRRLTITFALAVGLSAAALGTGTYLVVRHNLLADSGDSSVTQTKRNLGVARLLRASSPDELMDAYRSRGGFEAVVTRSGRVYLTGPQVTLQSVPDGLREVVARGDLGYQRAEVGGKRYVV